MTDCTSSYLSQGSHPDSLAKCSSPPLQHHQPVQILHHHHYDLYLPSHLSSTPSSSVFRSCGGAGVVGHPLIGEGEHTGLLLHCLALCIEHHSKLKVSSEISINKFGCCQSQSPFSSASWFLDQNFISKNWILIFPKKICAQRIVQKPWDQKTFG